MSGRPRKSGTLRIKRVFRKPNRLVRSESDVTGSPPRELQRITKARQSLSESALRVRFAEKEEDTSESSSSSSSDSESSFSDGSTASLHTREEVLLEINKAERDLKRLEMGRDLTTVGGQMRWRAANKNTMRRLQNAQRVLELLGVNEEATRKYEEAKASQEKTRRQRDKCHKTMVKWSAAHGQTLERLHATEMDLLQLKTKMGENVLE